VKNVTFSACTSSCTKVFTLRPRTPLKQSTMPAAKPRKQRPENHQNGRERPHFFGFQPPKKPRAIAAAAASQSAPNTAPS
jgi:hypothetical protein